MNEDLLPTDITIDQGNLIRGSDKKLGRNSSKRQLSDARQLGCVFQDMTPPKSILRKSTDMPKTIQRVKFKKAIARHTKIRDQNPSLGYICPGEPHERSPNAPKFEDRSQEETEWQEQGAREAAWKLAKNVFKLKEHEKAAFFSSPENRCHLASSLKPEEREFVVDSGASMHMISKKDLSEAEMDTLTRNPWRETTEETNPQIYCREKWKTKARLRSEMPVWTVSQKFSHLQWRRLFKELWADQQRLQISDLHFDKFPTPATFACWKIRFKTEVCTCSQFPTEAMQ